MDKNVIDELQKTLDLIMCELMSVSAKQEALSELVSHVCGQTLNEDEKTNAYKLYCKQLENKLEEASEGLAEMVYNSRAAALRFLANRDYIRAMKDRYNVSD